MTPPDHKEDQVRHLLDSTHPPVPADLSARAVERGTRLLRRRRSLHAALWTVLVIAAVLFAAWAVTAQPWRMPESPPPPASPW